MINNQANRGAILEAVTLKKPIKSYIKTILGRVHVNVWDPFQNIPVATILEGDPRKKEEGCIVDLYSESEVVFFKRANKRHLELGVLAEFERSDDEEEKSPAPETMSDEELRTIINSPFLKFQSMLNQTNSEALLFRLENLAQEMEKSDKIIKAIRGRLAEVQNESLPKFPEQIEKELE